MQSIFIAAGKFSRSVSSIDKLSSAALIVSLNLNDPERAASLYTRCSSLYVAHGSTERAAEMLERAASLTSSVEDASRLFFEAIDIYEVDDRLRSSVSCFTRGISFLLLKRQVFRSTLLFYLSAVFESGRPGVSACECAGKGICPFL